MKLVCIDRVRGVFINRLYSTSILAVVFKIKQYFMYMCNSFF